MSIDEEIKRYAINAEYERTHGNLQGCLEFRQLADWLKELKQLREQTRWIPVSERLPEVGQRVIATVESIDGNYVRETICGKYGLLCGNGIAWMPLPEPYNAEWSEE